MEAPTIKLQWLIALHLNLALQIAIRSSGLRGSKQTHDNNKMKDHRGHQCDCSGASMTPRRAPSGGVRKDPLRTFQMGGSKWTHSGLPLDVFQGGPTSPPDRRLEGGWRAAQRGPAPIFFWPKLKSESKTDQNLWSKNGHRTISLISPECEPARILDSRGRFSTTIRGRFSTTHFHR